MARQKGDGKGRLGGRKAGTPNLSTRLNKDKIQAFIEDHWPDFENAMSRIDNPKDQCMIMLKLMEFVIPKMSSVEVKGEAEAPDWMKKIDDIRKK